MIDYTIELEVPAPDGSRRWMQLGPSTGNLDAIKPVYDALVAEGDRVRLVQYGPAVLHDYRDAQAAPAMKAVAPPAPSVAPESLIKTGPDGRITLPTAQEILDRVNAQGITPVDDDEVASAVTSPDPEVHEEELSDRQRELYAAAGLIPSDEELLHAWKTGELEVVGCDADHPEENSGPATPATQELEPLPAPESELKLTTRDAAQLEEALDAPAAPVDAPALTEAAQAYAEGRLMPGDPGFMEQFQAAQAAKVIHRHADGTRTTRVSQALS